MITEKTLKNSPRLKFEASNRTPVHFMYRAEIRASCTVQILTIYGKQDGTPNDPLLVKIKIYNCNIWMIIPNPWKEFLVKDISISIKQQTLCFIKLQWEPKNAEIN